MVYNCLAWFSSMSKLCWSYIGDQRTTFYWSLLVKAILGFYMSCAKSKVPRGERERERKQGGETFISCIWVEFRVYGMLWILVERGGWCTIIVLKVFCMPTSLRWGPMLLFCYIFGLPITWHFMLIDLHWLFSPLTLFQVAITLLPTLDDGPQWFEIVCPFVPWIG